MSVAGIMFNTGVGQHILKNPLIVNSVIEKVCCSELTHKHSLSWYHITHKPLLCVCFRLP